MKKHIDIRVTALGEEELKEFIIALRKIQWCGNVGASRTLPIHIDGDGSGGMKFEIINKAGDEMIDISTIVNLDEKAMDKVAYGDDFETHYIGE